MHSRSECRQWWCKIALTLIASAAMIGFSALASAEGAQAVTEENVAAAIEKLKADPNLATQRTMRTLRWKGEHKQEKPKEPGNWFGWFGELLRWIAQSGRVIVWLAVGVLAALLVLLILRLVREVGPRSVARAFDAPTHVRDLDIRPESLPDDIGAAALELWRKGEHRASLSLLYRGLLSRLVHVHSVPIRNSTTEGDCVVLSGQHLEGESLNYVRRLVGIWQLAVYGGHEPRTEDIQAICDGFSAALAPRSTGAPAP